MRAKLGYLGLCLSAVLATAAHPVTPTASATLVDVRGKTVGVARFSQGSEGVEMTVWVTGLTPGAHGMHVHATGACDGPDFKSAGAHFNPTDAQHGLANPRGPHVGDMPNLVVGADGTATAKATLAGATLRAGPTSLLKAGGTALVIHAGPDDQRTDPSGGSGDRVVCGVIRQDR